MSLIIVSLLTSVSRMARCSASQLQAFTSGSKTAVPFLSISQAVSEKKEGVRGVCAQLFFILFFFAKFIYFFQF